MAEDKEPGKQLAWLQHRYQLEYEMVRATSAFEHEVLKPLFLLNGGALVAVLTLYGALKGDHISGSILAFAIAGWILGIVFATASASCAASSQFNFRKLRGTEAVLAEKTLDISEDSRSADDLKRDAGGFTAVAGLHRWIAIWFGLASMLMFLLSLIPAFLAIR